MKTTRLPRRPSALRLAERLARCAALAALVSVAAPGEAANLRVMRMGLGEGSISSNPSGISCGATCDSALVGMVTLTASPGAGSTFVGWRGDCAGASCTVDMSVDRAVRAEFQPTVAIPPLAIDPDATVTLNAIDTYLATNTAVDTPAEVLAALPLAYRRNWLMMARSESLQTGIAEVPRFLLPDQDARNVFTFGVVTHPSYPGAHPNAIEYMQWDPAAKNFRFHEVVVDAIPPMGAFPARSRGVSRDDARCSKCHSTRNVLNPGPFPGTSGIPPGSVAVKNKPNWDTYDSWGGLLPLNRDRIYKGSVEAASFRRIFNPWTWRNNAPVRAFVEQLELQPPDVPAAHEITRIEGGANDGHVNFAFDDAPPVASEPAPVGTSTASIGYSFDGQPAGSDTTVQRDGTFLTLHHAGTPTNDEGRAVQLFDLLGGADGNFNQLRIGNELAGHRFATGGIPLDARPIALAITKSCYARIGSTVSPVPAKLDFFTARHGGLNVADIHADTLARARSMPIRKADIEKHNLDRTADPYLDQILGPANGLVQQDGGATSFGTSTALSRLRQEVFRRSTSGFQADATNIGGFYVDREDYTNGVFNTELMALFRYFLEPLGVAVDKWSMGVRGRSRTYSFADVLAINYLPHLRSELETSLTADPFPGLAAPFDCASLRTAVNTSFTGLPAAEAVPTFADVQRVFNKGCIECHGGLDYPPFSVFFPANYLDLSEDENPPAGQDRLQRSYDMAVTFTSADPASSYLFQRVIDTSEECPNGVMPCGGPKLSQTDIDTLRRWIVGSRPYTNGDPHLRTVDGTDYDFQSAGEFVLLRGQGLEIQIRQSPVQTAAPLPPDGHTGLSSCVSINTAAAIRVGGHRVTYQPALGQEGGLELRVDGRLTRLGSGVNLPQGGRLLPTGVPGGVQIEYQGGTDIVLTPGFWEYYRVWYLNIDVRRARATEGVMGAIAPRNWLPALPSGHLLGPRPAGLAERYQVLYEQFADAWRVTDDSSLFDYARGTSTKTFTLDRWPGATPVCRLPSPGPGKPPQRPLEREQARSLCAEVFDPGRRLNCEKDVMVTGEASFAATYVATDQIQTRPAPVAPELINPADNLTDFAGLLDFGWQEARGLRDDERLTYRLCLWVAGEPLTFESCRELPRDAGRYQGLEATRSLASMRLEPGKSYFWKVLVEDGQGGTAESSTRRFSTRR